jgi:hypothetical protein
VGEIKAVRRVFAVLIVELWVAPRGGHVGAINAWPDEYSARVLAFLRGALG